uniref:TPR_REGION domain-containing protein n=1 Tax=Angiostrongylus cantonensis TaxID=6313 RepID=A0A0K0DPA3_ANGCA
MITADINALAASSAAAFTDYREEMERSTLSETDHKILITRYISQGDYETATFWIDILYAKKSEASFSLFDFAQYIKDLTVVQQYKRISELILSRHLVKKHLVFAYYYINALYHLRMFSVIVQLPIGNLMPSDGLPVRYPDVHCGLEDYLDSLSTDITVIDVMQLNKMVVSLKLFSALMVVYGRTYILLENRDFATRCLTAAFLQDRHCLVAEQLLKKYRLVPTTGSDPCYRLVFKFILDLSIDVIVDFFKDCVLLHANCLHYFQDWKRLFLLAHELVLSFPDHHYSWYVVAVYYFTCNNIAAAKNFINKAALMRRAFGEAWIAYGHILATECENEQALNCYYRAARILPWHYEPKMYIGMQYCRVGVRMAEDFLREASCLKSCDPIVMHERGSYYYRYSKFRTAEQFFHNALLAVVGKEVGLEYANPFLIMSKQIDRFWQPLLSSLGHVSRRLGKYKESIAFHKSVFFYRTATVLHENVLRNIVNLWVMLL